MTFKSNPDSLPAKESRDNISSSRKKVGALNSSKNLKLPPIYDKSPHKYNPIEPVDDSSHHHSHHSHAHSHAGFDLAMFPEFKKNLKARVIKYQSRGAQQFNDSDSQDNGDDGHSSDEPAKGILSKLERKEQLLNEQLQKNR